MLALKTAAMNILETVSMKILSVMITMLALLIAAVQNMVVNTPLLFVKIKLVMILPAIVPTDVITLL
jgi:hypothetical protein